MDFHKNARLVFRSREALARHVLGQETTRKAAAAATLPITPCCGRFAILVTQDACSLLDFSISKAKS